MVPDILEAVDYFQDTLRTGIVRVGGGITGEGRLFHRTQSGSFQPNILCECGVCEGVYVM